MAETKKPVTMLCTYTPKAGQEQAFLALLEKHWPALHAQGLATDQKATVWRATDKQGGVRFVELFQWKDEGSSSVAHQTPEVMAVWEPMGAIADDLRFWQVEQVPMPFDA